MEVFLLYSFRPSLSLKHSLYSAGRSTVLILALSFLLFFFVFQSPSTPCTGSRCSA